MTTVLGVEGYYKTTLAADSQVTQGFSKQNGFVKIVKNGEYTFAAAGFARSIQILQYANLPPVPSQTVYSDHSEFEHPTLDRFFTNEIIPAVREAFEIQDLDALEESEILVAVRNRLYTVSGGCGAWMRSPSGFYAVGSGADFALGALEAGATPRQAVEIAGKFDIGSNGDVREVTIPAV